MFIKCLLLFFVLSFVEAEPYNRPQSQLCHVPRILHGRARLRQRGTFIKYTCSSGYTLVGNRYATCRFGQWDEPVPICVKPGCPPLPEVKNAVNITSHNNAWVVFFCLHGQRLMGSPTMYCDGSQWNATVPGCYDSATKLSTECDFEESNICGWRPDDLHDFDWRRWTGRTPSYFVQTGPAEDHTYGKSGSGHYMYIESTGVDQDNTARLLSPVYDAELAKNGCFVFYYHMYGRSMGGLRVYQKPDKIPLYRLIREQTVKNNYTLFNKWGDQGNAWYCSVSMLSDVSDDFQIVIEGIRGFSFMSDIAIDDVSIQHGENCTKAMNEASTPSSVLLESCVGRCDRTGEVTGFRGCSCSIVCVVTQNCCPDFLDVCDYDTSTNQTADDDGLSTIPQPQTQKLVATTTEALPPTTTSTTTSTTSSTSTTVATPEPTTTSTSTTTTAKTTTTQRTTTTTTKPPIPKKTTPSTTTKAVEPIITRKSTTLSISSTTFVIVRTTKHDINETNTAKGKHDKIVAKKAGGMSGGAVAVTVVLVGVALVGALWIAYVATRTTRGVAALAHIRGRTSSDPEVHYLKSDVDDE